MSEHQVTVEFRGICTHFRNTVPGTPHRAVLPRSASWEPGVLVAPGIEQPVFYLLPPHFSYVFFQQDSGGEPQVFSAPGIIDSWIVAGVRLQIANAIGEELDYEGYDLSVPHVADYVPRYRYSEDVLIGGRAACYFDFFRGRVSSYLHGQAVRTTVTMKTDGPPRLQVTLLDRSLGSKPSVLDVPVEPYVVVANSGLSCDDANVDFLWHFVTSEESIPQELTRVPYGYDSVRNCKPESPSEQLSKLLALGYPGRLTVAPGSTHMVESEASCSNSQYP